jgi:hypothetical protein
MTHYSRVALVAAAIAAAGTLVSGQTRVQVKDRTTPLLKALSPADAYHATLFDGLGQFQKPLDVLASVDAVDDLTRLPAPPRATRDVIRQAACEVDTAFAAEITEAKSYPTRDGLFLWTSYRARITKALRQGASAKPPAGVVTVVRPGGSIVLEGMTVEARSNAWPPLAVGTQYYLFTSLLDKTGAYKSSNRSATYQVDGTSVRLLGLTNDERLQTGIPVDEFEASLRGLTCGK